MPNFGTGITKINNKNPFICKTLDTYINNYILFSIKCKILHKRIFLNYLL